MMIILIMNMKMIKGVYVDENKLWWTRKAEQYETFVWNFNIRTPSIITTSMTKAKDDGDDDVYVQPEVPTQWSDTFCNSKLILVIWEHTSYVKSKFQSFSLHYIVLSPSSLFISSAIVFFTCDKGNIIRGKLTCGRTTMGDKWRHSEPQVNKQCRHRLRYCTINRSWTVLRVFGVSWII